MPFTIIEDRAQRIWEPNPRQADAISMPDEIFELLFGGAAGGGKSEYLLALPIVRGWIHKSNFRGIIFRKTFPQLEESLIPRSKELYKPVGGRYNESKHYWTFPSGATIFLSYMQRDEDARDHDTAEYNYVGFDELTHFSEFQYSFIAHSRVRGDIRCVRAGSNPGNIGHIWVRDRFVKPARAGYVALRDKKSGEYRMFIPSKVQDNTYLAKVDPTYVNRLMMLPEAERKAKLDGDWFSFAGMVFTEFREEHQDGEPENAIHICDPFTIPDWWPKFAAIDWGHAAHTWIGWAAVSPKRQVYLYREYHQKGKYVSEWAREFAIRSHYDRLKAVVIDPSAQQKRGDPKSILEQFREHSGYNPLLADNDRVTGKMLMHDYLRWQVPEIDKSVIGTFTAEIYEKVLRTSGVEAAERYKLLFDPTPYPLPRLQIFRGAAPMFVQAIQLAQYNMETGNPEDVMEWDSTESSGVVVPGDDPYDGGRYLIKLVDRWLRDPSIIAEDEKRKEFDGALQALAATGDQNGFYRRMEILEAKYKAQGKPVKFFHKRRIPSRRTSGYRM